MQQVRNGKIKPIAVTGAKRVESLPNVPTVGETIHHDWGRKFFAHLPEDPILEEHLDQPYVRPGTTLDLLAETPNGLRDSILVAREPIEHAGRRKLVLWHGERRIKEETFYGLFGNRFQRISSESFGLILQRVSHFFVIDPGTRPQYVFPLPQFARVGVSTRVLEEILDFGAALSCAEAVGAMKFACDTTLEYLKTRRQFGVPIGTFQALQHRMVDMYISYEQAKSMACLACSKADGALDGRDRAKAISAARIKIADAARHISQESVQLHGGMGMSDELKVSHTFRRLTALGRRFGDVDQHLARFASL